MPQLKIYKREEENRENMHGSIRKINKNYICDIFNILLLLLVGYFNLYRGVGGVKCDGLLGSGRMGLV